MFIGIEQRVTGASTWRAHLLVANTRSNASSVLAVILSN